MAVIIQIRRDTEANWTSANPILAQGEIGENLDNELIKIGDGVNNWLDLDYYGSTASGIIDHGNLLGLGDDDHPQYHNDTRGDARYYTQTLLDGGQLDDRYYTESEVDTISGTLNTKIDNLDYYTTSEVDTISGSLQTSIDNHTGDATIHFTEASIDHGAIAGLGDDDHPQYHNDARGDIRYYTQAQVDVLIATVSGQLDDHSELNGLDYASSGHTGFQPSGDYATNSILSTASGVLQSQITKNANDIVSVSGSIITDHSVLSNLDYASSGHTGFQPAGDYATNTSLSTTSGSLQTQIDGKADINHTHVEADITNLDKYTQAEVDALLATTSGSLFNQITTTSGSLYSTIITTSGSLQNEIDYLESLITSTSGSIITDHGELDGLGDDDHPQYHNDTRGDIRYYTKTLLDAGQLDNRYYTETEVDYIVSTASGSLQIQIDGKSDIGHTHVEADITDLDKYTQAEVDALITSTSGAIITDHGALSGLLDDDHTQYILVDGSRGFTDTVSGVDPIENYHLSTKFYVDNELATFSGIGPKGDTGFGVFAFARVQGNGTVLDSYNLNVSRTSTGVYSCSFADLIPTDSNHAIHAQPYQTVTDTNAMISSVTSSSFVVEIGQGDNGTTPDTLLDTDFAVVVFRSEGAPTVSGTLVSSFLDLNDTPSDYSGFVGQYLRVTATGIEFVPVSFDHGDLSGLGDDDHPQYHNDARGDARYYTQTYIDTLSGTLQNEIDTKADINHTHVEADITDLDKYTQAEVDALVASASGTTDHGALDGLSDDDHNQYTLVDGTRDFTGKVSYDSHPTFTTDTEIVDKKYVDDEIDNLTTDHGELTGLTDDDHPQYVLVNGSRGFTGTVSGISPTASGHLATKSYVDSITVSGTQVKDIPAGALKEGTSAVPGTATAGVITARMFDDATNEYLYGSFDISSEYISGTDITVNINFMNDDGQTGTNSCDWRFSYHIYDDGDTFGSKSTTVEDVSVAFPNNATAGTFKTGQITMDSGDSNNPIVAGETVTFRIERRAGNVTDTLSGDAALILISCEIEVRYE